MNIEMSNFIKQIEIDGQMLEFNFARIHTVSGAKYFVTVADSISEYHFVIEKTSGEWMLNDAPKVPQWIHDLEARLVGAIVESEGE
jgi:hypothetical protein